MQLQGHGCWRAIPLSWLLAAQKHAANNKVVSSDEKRIGVDVARSGADSTVFFFREGSSVKDSTHTQKKQNNVNVNPKLLESDSVIFSLPMTKINNISLPKFRHLYT